MRPGPDYRLCGQSVQASDTASFVTTSVDFGSVGQEALEYLRSLIRIDTSNPPGNERPAAEWIAELLERERIEYQMIESAPRRTSIVARLRGTGRLGALLLNGHLDVVPAERARWTHDPFAAVEADGCIWGRGSIDMKNMVAMSLMTLVLLKRAGAVLDRDLIVAAVADEEAGSRLGSLYLVERHPDLVRAEYVLNEVGGHTLHVERARLYPVQVSEKGVCWFELSAEGLPGHGSMPDPNSAIVKLTRAATRLNDVRLRERVTPVVRQFVRSMARELPFPQNRLLPLVLDPRLSTQLLDAMQHRAPEQARALNAMIRNTATVTQLAAGYKVNVIPSRATAQVDGRVIPGVTAEAFLEEIRQVVGSELGIQVLEQHDGTVFSSETPLFAAIARAVERRDPGARVVPYMIPGYTDAFAYGKLGATCYGFSPVRLGPDLNFSRLYHGHDERIPIDGFLWGLQVLYELVREFCVAR